MKSLLEEYYFSEVMPNNASVPKDKEYIKLMKRLFSCEEHFYEILDSAERAQFQSYLEDQSEMNAIDWLDSFVAGFRLGVRILLEALEQAK